MKLNEKEIDSLFEFTEKHYVEYYDLQLELVDHMANDIEDILEENPKLTFSEARDKAFKKFGIFGFTEIQEEKEKSMHDEYRNLVFKMFWNQFKFPRIFRTLFIFALMFSFFKILPFQYAFIGFGILYFSKLIFNLVKSFQHRKKNKGKKKLLFEVILIKFKYLGNGALGTGAILPIYFNPDNLTKTTDLAFNSTNIYLVVIATIIAAVWVLLEIIFTKDIPDIENDLLEKKYPYYKLIH
ncbi:hypothetical protein [Aureivirga sp. CE67]|uniref:hypothetical protein n=1 Tax=Aureivirga sp. CE67 TaxID=1788983 RepID=UPI0018CA6B80|nr:hypothetical protein [Aureivirga sp. CE67]